MTGPGCPGVGDRQSSLGMTACPVPCLLGASNPLQSEAWWAGPRAVPRCPTSFSSYKPPNQ